jgi:hypothetical protein
MEDQDEDDAEIQPTSDAAAAQSPDDVEIKPDQAAVSNGDAHQSITHSMNQVPKFSEEWFKLKEKEISLRNGLSDELGEEETANALKEDESSKEKMSDQVDEVDAPSMIANEDRLHLGCVTDTDPSNKKVEAIADEAQVVAVDDIAAQEPGELNKNHLKLARPEQITSTSDAPLPAGLIDVDDEEVKKNGRLGLEVMPSESAWAPVPVGHKTDDDMEKKLKGGACPEQVLDDSVPIPLTIFEQNNDDLGKKIRAAPSEANNIESNFHGAREDEVPSGNITQLTPRQVGFLDTVHSSEHANTSRVNTSRAHISGTDTSRGTTSHRVVETQRQTYISSLADTSLRPDAIDASIAEIPEAFLVEDEKDVAFAELVPPWWKRKQTYIAGFVVLLIVIGAAVGGVRYTQKRASQNEVIVFVANETTAAPSISLAPSGSQMPSSRPSSCVDRSSMDPQKLEFVYFNLTFPSCEIDGSHAVVVDIHVEEGVAYMYAIFYHLNRGIWEKSQDFIEYLSEGNDTDLEIGIGPWIYESDAYWNDQCAVSMSKDTVFIGVPFMNNGTGTVFVYEFNDRFATWRLLYDAISPEVEMLGARFGQSLDIDNDLAVVSAPGNDTMHVYLRDGSSWKRVTSFDMVNTTDVAVNGDTIAVTARCEVHLFHYNHKSMTVEYQQHVAGKDQDLDPCSSFWGVGSLALSRNHLAVSAHFDRFESQCGDCETYPYSLRGCSKYPIFDVALFYRTDDSENFTFVQLINSTYFELGFGPNLALEEDFLVVGGVGNKSNSFVFNDGYWKESLELETPDQCGFDGYDDEVHISNRDAVVVTDDGVYVYHIEECANSPSSVPSEAPTSSPTMSCFMIKIFAEHYHALKPVWSFERLNETNVVEPSDILLESPSPTLRPTWGATTNAGDSYNPFKLTYINESTCLKEGRYRFTIYNDPLFYNVTTTDGKLIAEGEKPGFQEATIFQVPFIN